MTVRRRPPVMALAVAVSLACHLALLSWLALTPGLAFRSPTLEVVLVAKSRESRIAAPSESLPDTTPGSMPDSVPDSMADSAPGPPHSEAPGPAPPLAASDPPPTAGAAHPAVAPDAAVPESQAAAEPAAEVSLQGAIVAASATADALAPHPGSRQQPATQSSAQAPRSSAGQDSMSAGVKLAIRQRLAEFLNYPPAARRRAIEGDPVVRFVIARDGSLLEHDLARSSGSRHLDRAALQLVRDAAPYPGFPPALELARLEVRLPIEYRLTRLPPS